MCSGSVRYGEKMERTQELDQRYSVGSGHVKNMIEEDYESLEKAITDWSLPTVKPSCIYKIGTFDLKSRYVIKTMEKTLPIRNRTSSIIQLLDDSIHKYQKSYQYLHIGMIQIGLKPLTREGLNASILVSLQDQRHLQYKDSLLGVLETSLCNGPVYFQCIPNFSVSLTDVNIRDVLTLRVQTHDYNMKPGSENIALVYRIHYKVMNTLAPRTKVLPSEKGQTVIFETNLRQANVTIPRTLSWDEVSLPSEWNLEHATNPQMDSHTLEKIIEHTDGTVSLSFERNRQVPRISYSASSRKSTSHLGKPIITSLASSSSHDEMAPEDVDNASNYEASSKLKGLWKDPIGIHHGVYSHSKPSASPSYLRRQNSAPHGPSPSEMDFPTINVVEVSPFQITKEFQAKLQQEYEENPQFDNFRTQFRRIYTLEHRKEVSSKYITWMRENQKVISFPEWYNTIFFPGKENPLIATFKLDKVTEDLSLKETEVLVNDKVLPVLGMTNVEETDTSLSAKRDYLIIKQNNFTNVSLKLLHSKVSTMDDQIKRIVKGKGKDDRSSLPQSILPLPVISGNPKPLQSQVIPATIKPPVKFTTEPYKIGSNEMVNHLIERLDKLKISENHSSLGMVGVKDLQPSVDDLDSLEDISLEDHGLSNVPLENKSLEDYGLCNEPSSSKDSALLKEHSSTDIPLVGKVYFPNKTYKHTNNPTSRTYYPRPTPVDMLYEETEQRQQNAYDSNAIYDWNIDGASDHIIRQTLHQMLMFATVCKARGNSDQACAELITAGFSGSLKGWWDNYLTASQKQSILQSVKIEEGHSTQQPDAVYTLVQNIYHHYIGNASWIHNNSDTLLMNLRCPTLSHFRWYKDVFFTRVVQRPDANAIRWKEQFLNGLPPLFANKIKERIRNRHNGQLPLENYNYGDLFSECISEGLSLCNDLQLRQQLKSQRLTGRRELGEFCAQFAYADNKIPGGYHRSNSNSKRRHSPPPRNYKSKRKRIKPLEKPRSSYTQKKSIKRRQSKKADTTPRCYKCGRKGHYANKCFAKTALKVIQNEEERQKVQVLLQINDTDSELEKTSSESSVNELDYVSLEEDSSSDDEHCLPGQCSCSGRNPDSKYADIIQTMNGLHINVLSSTQNYILELLDKITDPREREKQIRNYLEIQIQEIKDSETEKFRKANRVIEPYTFKEVLNRMKGEEHSVRTPTLAELHQEVQNLKIEVKELKSLVEILRENQNQIPASPAESSHARAEESTFLGALGTAKWLVTITLVVSDSEIHETTALLDSGADMNCIREGLLPTSYFLKKAMNITVANNKTVKIKYFLPKAFICNNDVCIETDFILVKDLSNPIILGTPFLRKLYPITITNEGLSAQLQGHPLMFKWCRSHEVSLLHSLQETIQMKTLHLNSLHQEYQILKIQDRLSSSEFQRVIKDIEKEITSSICSDLPTAFWERKKHVVYLPYEKDFNDKMIPTKARPAQMSKELVEYCRKEIQDLLQKNLIRESRSPWSCTAFYVNKNAELERGVPRLVINYKPLNKALQWIRYPIPNKSDLLKRLNEAIIFSKFDLKSGFWQIQIAEEDRYKTAFTVPFGQYEWNVMPFGLKNAPSEFQKIMNDIFTPYMHFIIVYIDDILIFSSTLDQHVKHLRCFIKIALHHGLVTSARKMKLFQLNVRFLGHNIENGKIIPIERSLSFGDKFPDVITDKTQLQRFLGSLNYISNFYQHLAQDSKLLYQRLQKNPSPWTEAHTQAVRRIKLRIKQIPCLSLPNPSWPFIVETDASDIGYGGILKQKNPTTNQEVLIRFTSGIWKTAELNYSTVKKEMLSIVKCVSKFQDDLLNQFFIIRIDCQSVKYILDKDVANLVSKQIFARWQAILSVFDFSIEYIKGENNSLPDFLTREFLQNSK